MIGAAREIRLQVAACDADHATWLVAKPLYSVGVMVDFPEILELDRQVPIPSHPHTLGEQQSGSWERGAGKVALPDFDSNGLLPAGRYVETEDEVHHDLVDEFPTSTRRQFIYDRWMLHRHTLTNLVNVHEQWLDGSFTESKVDPDDVDIVTVYDGDAWDAMTDEERFLPFSLMNGHWTEQFWKVDSFGVGFYNPGHPMWAACQGAIDYWHNWWGHTRPDDPRGHLTKGYVVVQ